VLANLSFTYDLHLKQNPSQKCYGREKTLCIEAKYSDHPDGSFTGDKWPDNYYCEYQLSEYYKKVHDEEVSVFAFNLRESSKISFGVAEYEAAIKDIMKRNQLDTIVLGKISFFFLFLFSNRFVCVCRWICVSKLL
jgi:hypothetical protein